jgi:hypothetical protein
MLNVKPKVMPAIIGQLETLKIIKEIPEQHTGKA